MNNKRDVGYGYVVYGAILIVAGILVVVFSVIGLIRVVAPFYAGTWYRNYLTLMATILMVIGGMLVFIGAKKS